MKERNCIDCDEPFEPVGRERICPECRLERDIDAEDLRDQHKAEGVEFVDIDESMRDEDEDFEAFHHYGWGDD